MTNVLKNKNDAYINELKHGKTYLFNLFSKCIMYFIENFKLIKINVFNRHLRQILRYPETRKSVVSDKIF